MNVALLEDDEAQSELVKSWITAMGHTPQHSTHCADFLANLNKSEAQLMILDWELPDGTGIDVLKSVRQTHPDTPILFVTQRDTEEDVVTALTQGADDFLSKPLREKEFFARIQALSRRAKNIEKPNNIILGQFEVDLAKHTIFRNDEPIELTRKDFDLAVCLFQNCGKALSRDYLLSQVWGVNTELDTRTVDMHISRIRRALPIKPDAGLIIKTIYRFGYRLEKIESKSH